MGNESRGPESRGRTASTAGSGEPNGELPTTGRSSRLVAAVTEAPFVRNVALLSSAAALSQLIVVLAIPVVTRLYTPDDLGVLTLFLSIVLIAAPLATLRYSVAIPIADTDELADDVLRLCFLITTGLALAMLPVLFGLQQFTSLFNSAKVAGFTWLIPLVFVFSGFYQALAQWAVRSRDFKLIATTRVTRSFAMVATQLGLGFLGVAPLGLLLGQLANHGSGAPRILTRVLNSRSQFFGSFRLDKVRFAAHRFRRFPLIQTWSQLLLVVAGQLPAIFIASRYGLIQAGLYGFAERMVNLPMALLGESVGQVYYSEVASLWRTAPDKIRAITRGVMTKLASVAVIPTAIILLAGPTMFRIVFGASWTDAGRFAQILAVLGMARLITVPVVNCLNVLELQAWQFGANLVRVAIAVCAFLLAVGFGLSVTDFLLIFSAASVLFHLGFATTLLRYLRAPSELR